MKKIVLYYTMNQLYGKDLFLDEMVFPSLISYFKDNNIKYEVCVDSSICAIKNSIVLVGGFFLIPENILKFKNNNNIICSFDINDQTRLKETYANNEEAKLIDFIFKYAGIQRKQEIKDIKISNNLDYTIVSKKSICPEKAEEIYYYFVDSDKIAPMPHNPWQNYILNFEKSFQKRSKKVLIRGAHHYYRYHLFLNLIKLNLLAPNSLFKGAEYFGQCCPSCKDYGNKVGTFDYDSFNHVDCSNDIPWQDKVLEDNFFNTYSWHNKCIPMFIWLADKFNNKYGKIDFNTVVNLLNSTYTHTTLFMNYISTALFYGDFKWSSSIYIPPRFWEAASVKTINFLPKFTNEQEHYGGLKEGEHYVTFEVDFSNLEQAIDINEEKYKYISENAFQVYNTMIKGDKYPISTNLLKYITSKLEEF